MKIALFPGSFDPITNGHIDIVSRAFKIFDKVIILVAINKDKKERFSSVEKLEMIKESLSEYNLNNVEVAFTEGLTVEYAKKVGATHLIRGLRAATDFEYEFQLACQNLSIDNNIDTVFLMSKEDKTSINSTAVYEMAKNGIDVSNLVPKAVVKRLTK